MPPKLTPEMVPLLSRLTVTQVSQAFLYLETEMESPVPEELVKLSYQEWEILAHLLEMTYEERRHYSLH